MAKQQKGFWFVLRAVSVSGTPWTPSFLTLHNGSITREREQRTGGLLLLARRHNQSPRTANKTCYYHSLTDQEMYMMVLERMDYGPSVDLFHPGKHMWAFLMGVKLDGVLRLHFFDCLSPHGDSSSGGVILEVCDIPSHPVQVIFHCYQLSLGCLKLLLEESNPKD